MEYTVGFDTFTLTLKSEDGLFSPRGTDRGTMAMLSCVALQPGEAVLDLGCGSGLVGLYAAMRCGAANVWLTDIDERAVSCAEENAGRNGIEGLHFCRGNAYEGVDRAGFDWILSNPPYQSDFSVAKTFIEKGFNRLKMGGRLVMVTKRLEWYRNKLISVFGGAHIDRVDGYYVFTAQKRSMRYAKKRDTVAFGNNNLHKESHCSLKR
ncbi:MAG: methyltransferase domain-containing protein [Clostridiales bacterium]|nr:methyltransferase domain-containing protein [Clostridiales bacterium]